MLPARLVTTAVRLAAAAGAGEEEVAGGGDDQNFAYEFPNGKRVPFDLARPEKRLKFSFAASSSSARQPSSSQDGEDTADDRNNNDEAAEEGNEEDEDDDAASVVSSSSSAAAANNARETLTPEQEQAVKLKLRACMYELAQLSEVLQAKELGSIRIERTPQSQQEREQSLAVAHIKRQAAFGKALDMFATRRAGMERDVVHTGRGYFKHLEVLARRYRVVAPTHSSLAQSSLKPDEPLAIELGGGSNKLVYLRRGGSGGSGMSLVLEEEDGGTNRTPVEEFKPQALEVELFVNRESKGKGSAKTRGFHKCQNEHETALESVIRDHLARQLLASLSLSSDGACAIIQLDTCTHLAFKLAPESKHADLLSLNKFDGVCSLALNLVQRGKSSECIQQCCAHLLHFGTLDSVLGRWQWQHSDDDTDHPELVETRCLVEFGASGKYAAEFVSAAGGGVGAARTRQLQLDWHTFDGADEVGVVEDGMDIGSGSASEADVGQLLQVGSGGSAADLVGVVQRGQCHALLLELMSIVNHSLPHKFKAERVAVDGGGGAFRIVYQQDVVGKVTVKSTAFKSLVVCELETPVGAEDDDATGGGGGGDATVRRDISAHPFYELRRLMRRTGGVA